jgi:hypothetical protein
MATLLRRKTISRLQAIGAPIRWIRQENIFSIGRPLYGEPAVTLANQSQPKWAALEFVLNSVSTYQEYLINPIQATLKRVEGGYLSDRIVLDEGEMMFSRSYSL